MPWFIIIHYRIFFTISPKQKMKIVNSKERERSQEYI
uniref:Uncharacterized protein n=1 Tax=viral metagenome TaxID=1070528 RepID=A0A6C0LF30_9ZZZZ